MLIALPAFAFSAILLSVRRRLPSRCWREAFVAAAVICGVLVVLLNEGLSLFQRFGRLEITVAWSTVCFAAIGSLWPLRKRPTSPAPTAPSDGQGVVSRVLLSGILLYVIGTATIALIAPPNTWDVLEYHMPKVMHWIQNHGVGFYATAIPRQNHLAPGAEYVVAHLHLLSGSDRFTNLVEWFAMVGSLVAVSLIARELGAKALGQYGAAVFAVTLPMGIMQASSAQTDYVAAFWFVCFLYFLLRLWRTEANGIWTPLGLSASLGMGAMTKATVYLFAPAFLLWLALGLWKVRGRRVLISYSVIAIVFLAINGGHYARNWSLYGHPLGPREEPTPNTRYALEAHSPAALMSSLAKHVGSHLNTPWASVNDAILQGYKVCHQAIGWKLDDPRTTFGPSWVRFSISPTDFQDETAGNPLHFLLWMVCGALVVARPVLRRNRMLLKYTVALAGGFVIMALFLKWHPWMSRLHHGLFVAAAPLVGLVLGEARRAWVGWSVSALLLLLGLPWLLFCQERPVIARENIFNTPRDRLFFKTAHQRYEQSFLEGAAFLASQKVSLIGLVIDNSSWEYFWWQKLRRENAKLRFEHVNVRDVSAKLADQTRPDGFQPEAVLALDQQPQPERITVGERTFARRWSQGRVGIYLPE